MDHFDVEVDTTGLNCPLPIMHVNRISAGLKTGQIMKVIATDPGSIKDFATFCRNTNHELVSSYRSNEKFVYFFRKLARA